MLCRSSLFSLEGALSPVDEALVVKAALFQDTRNHFSFSLEWGSLSSTPFFALEGLVDEARRDLEMICWGDMATKDNKMSFVEEAVRDGSLALILKDRSLTNLHLYHNGFEVDN